MTGFAVFRHPDVAVPGVVPFEAAESQRIHGWYRVSDWSPSSAFNLPDFPADSADLDAPEPDPEPEVVAKTKTKHDTKTETEE